MILTSELELDVFEVNQQAYYIG